MNLLPKTLEMLKLSILEAEAQQCSLEGHTHIQLQRLQMKIHKILLNTLIKKNAVTTFTVPAIPSATAAGMPARRAAGFVRFTLGFTTTFTTLVCPAQPTGGLRNYL